MQWSTLQGEGYVVIAAVVLIIIAPRFWR